MPKARLRIRNTQAGFSLVEGMLAAALLALLVVAFVGVIIATKESTVVAGTRERAGLIAEEGFEASRNIRDAAFANVTTGSHGLAIVSDQWAFSGTTDTTDLFTRSVTFTALDKRRWLATSAVTWRQTTQRTGAMTLETYFTDWQRNFANWAVPTIQSSTDLTGAADAAEVAVYLTATTTYAVIARNASVAAELYVVDVTDPSSMTVVGTLELGADANDIAVVGNYAVIASSSNDQELQVVDLSTPTAPTLTGRLDLTGTVNALSVVGSGTTVFLGRNSSVNPEVYTISIATPSTPALLSTAELSGDATKMVLAQNDQYLYAATPDNSQEMAVLWVSTPTSITLVGSYNATGVSAGTAVTALATDAVLGRADGNIEVISVAIPTTPSLISSALDIGSQINDLTMGVGDIYVYAATTTVLTPTLIVNVAAPTTPSVLSSVIMLGNTTGITWDFDLNRALVTGTDNTSELKALKPN